MNFQNKSMQNLSFNQTKTKPGLTENPTNPDHRSENYQLKSPEFGKCEVSSAQLILPAGVIRDDFTECKKKKKKKSRADYVTRI